MSSWHRFPNPVNEKAARVVGAGVAVMSLVVLLTGWQWLVPFMAAGFLLRVVAGPRLSPLGLLATKVVAPRLGTPILVAGPPKQFAQAIGLTVTALASVLTLADHRGAAAGLIAVLLVFAVLESAAGFCAGCWAFGRLVRLGVVPEATCVACADIARHRGHVSAA